jgi:hypothetical protein
VISDGCPQQSKPLISSTQKQLRACRAAQSLRTLPEVAWWSMRI